MAQSKTPQQKATSALVMIDGKPHWDLAAPEVTVRLPWKFLGSTINLFVTYLRPTNTDLIKILNRRDILLSQKSDESDELEFENPPEQPLWDWFEENVTAPESCGVFELKNNKLVPVPDGFIEKLDAHTNFRVVFMAEFILKAIEDEESEAASESAPGKLDSVHDLMAQMEEDVVSYFVASLCDGKFKPTRVSIEIPMKEPVGTEASEFSQANRLATSRDQKRQRFTTRRRDWDDLFERKVDLQEISGLAYNGVRVQEAPGDAKMWLRFLPFPFKEKALRKRFRAFERGN